VSTKTQAWIYGSFIVIAGFIAAVAVYLVKQRRKVKAREDGMNYEFEALNDVDLEEGGRTRGSQPAGAGGRRKARDLYDAFGASEDEDALFSDDGDMSEKEDYYDHDAARGIDESGAGEDRQKLLGRENR